MGALLDAVGPGPLAGTFAIGNGSLKPAVAIAAAAPGTRRVVSSFPHRFARLASLGAGRRGVQVSGIWGGSLKDNAVGPAILVDFLPDALASGAYRALPGPTVVGEGLASIPAALERLRWGVSASKLVVSLPAGERGPRTPDGSVRTFDQGPRDS